MNKKEYYKYTGNIQQMFSVRSVVFNEGRAQGLDAYEVKNDRLSFCVMKGKCLDIAQVSWKGYNMSFLSKPGLTGRAHYDTHGLEAQRSIMGGMLFTCGLENICAPCCVDGKDYPMHGRLRTTPAEQTGADLIWDDDTSTGKIIINGQMREAELFGENMVLQRQIETPLGVPEIIIKDRIINEGFRDETMMLLYHFNSGFPFLNENCEIIIPSVDVCPRDEAAAAFVHRWNCMEKPEDNAPEQVFIHEMASDCDGNTFAAVINKAMDIGIKIEFNKKYLPYFMEWKSIASGDYALGLEPANSSVFGKEYHLKRGDLHKLSPFEHEDIVLKIRFMEGESLEILKNEAENLCLNYKNQL